MERCKTKFDKSGNVGAMILLHGFFTSFVVIVGVLRNFTIFKIFFDASCTFHDQTLVKGLNVCTMVP